MTKYVLACASILALVSVVTPALASDDCETRIEKLNKSKAEGSDRLMRRTK